MRPGARQDRGSGRAAPSADCAVAISSRSTSVAGSKASASGGWRSATIAMPLHGSMGHSKSPTTDFTFVLSNRTDQALSPKSRPVYAGL